jgi:RNA 3'-terminal phosphate cyclase (ATP)
MIELDGSSGEGGGQILRTALTLSLLTGRPFRMSQIRANRDKPGLRPQHLKAVEVAASIGGAKITGAKVSSSRVTFSPGEVVAGSRKIAIGTAGSTSLVLQTIHLPLAMRAEQPVRIILIGGTFNPKAPAFSFLDETWKPYLSAFGMPISLAMPQAGFYPQGGGRLEALIEPAQPLAFQQSSRGRLIRIRVIAGAANLPSHVADRMCKQASTRLASLSGKCEIEPEIVDWTSIGPGAALTLVAEHEGAIPATFVGLGELGKPAESVADEAVDQLLAFEAVDDAAVDPHSADQILLPLALAEGESIYTVSEMTEHLRTNIATIRAFLDRTITIEEPKGPGRHGTVTIT